MEMAIEERIRMMKKKKSKERGANNRRMDPGQPAKKKGRVEVEEVGAEAEDQELPRRTLVIHTRSPEKRKVGAEDKKPSKKVRPNNDIKKYITCRKWRLEEEKEAHEQHHTLNQPISPTQESYEAFARIGLVPTDEVSPKKLKTGESHQPGPAVEPLLGGVREERGARQMEFVKEGGPASDKD